MGFFKNIDDLLRFKLEQFSDRLITGEQKMKVIINDAKDMARGYKVELNMQRAEESRLHDLVKKLKKDIANSENAAIVAAKNQDRDLARRAVLRKGELEQTLREAEQALVEQTETVNGMMEKYKNMTDKIAETEREYSRMVIQKRQADAEAKISEARLGIHDPLSDMGAAADKFRREIFNAQGRVAPESESERLDREVARYEKMAREESVEDEVDKLLREHGQKTTA